MKHIQISKLRGQKQYETRQQVWTGYFNQTRLTDHSGIWVDLQLRLNDWFDEKSISIARLGYTYFLSDQLRLTAGYGYITQYALTEGMPDVPENRLWQQVQWFEKKQSVSLAQYFRVTWNSGLPGIYGFACETPLLIPCPAPY